MTPGSISISLWCVYFSIGNLYGELVRPLLHWISMGKRKRHLACQNHSPEPDHVCAYRIQRRICNSDSKVIVTLLALYTIWVMGAICV